MKHSVVISWRLSGLDMKLEWSNNKPVLGRKELDTPKKNLYFWRILQRILTWVWSSSFATPLALLYQVQWCSSGLWYQEPAILSFLDLEKFRRKELLSFLLYTRAMVSDTYLIASPFSASDRIKLAQDCSKVVDCRGSWGRRPLLLMSLFHSATVQITAYEENSNTQQTNPNKSLVRAHRNPRLF